MTQRTAALATLVVALVVAACSGGGGEASTATTAGNLTTPTPLEQPGASIIVSGPEELTIDEYFQRLVELDVRTSGATADLRERVDEGLLDVESAVVSDFENIGEFVMGLNALDPPAEMFANHESRIQSLMGYLVAFQDQRQLLEERSERDTKVCEETERLAADNGVVFDLECDLGDW